MRESMPSADPNRPDVAIISNGSKWAGQRPDDVDALLVRLQRNTLDPRFEEYGNFVIPLDDPAHLRPGATPEPAGTIRLWGNFYDVSGGFSIDGPSHQLADVIAAIRKNQRTRAYRQARAERSRRQREARAELRQRRRAR